MKKRFKDYINKKAILKSGLFDEKYYLLTYPEVEKSNLDPLTHYLQIGAKEGKNPSKEFDTKYYLKNNPDVKEIGINPLVHYVRFGIKEGRRRNIEDEESHISKHSKIKKIYRLIKYAKNNPQLIKRTFDEIKLHGLKKTIQKVKNKYSRIEEAIENQDKAKPFVVMESFFNHEIKIPSFEIDKPIDIIIPVYNGLEYLEPLINSIVKNTSMNYRVIICDDKSSDDRVLPLLKQLKDKNKTADITILENEKNLGFIKTVNRLVKHTKNHFVLLNTDTEVPPYWIERLMYPIFEMKNIASTTPFTNAGTICSFPNYLEDNLIFENMRVEELDKYFQYVNFEKTFIKIPTGVGFCMGVNKELVDKIGMFDEIFGKGYGEENDWCQRAIENGYKNIHVTNLFVYHKHGGSFPSEEKQRLISQNLFTLNKKHPTYDEQIQKLISENKLEILREYLQIKIKNQQLNTTLIIDHGLGGGANHYIDESIEKRVKNGEMLILLRYDFNVLKVYTIHFLALDLDYKFSVSNSVEIFEMLSNLKINEIFINSLVSYPNVHEMISEIIYLQEKINSKLVLPIHDFFPVCPSYTLLNQDMKYCEVPNDKNVCKNCLINNRNEFKIFEKEINIDEWRNSWNKINNLSDKIICFSNSSKDIYLKAYPKCKEKIEVIPHNISGRYNKIYDTNKKEDRVVIGILGAINEAKGANIVKDMVSYIDKNNLNIKVVVIGQITIAINSKSFAVTGRYDKKELPNLVLKHKITKFFIPLIWPETFSYTTDEIIQMAYPLTVFDLGAPAERVRNYELGKVIKIGEEIKELLS